MMNWVWPKIGNESAARKAQLQGCFAALFLAMISLIYAGKDFNGKTWVSEAEFYSEMLTFAIFAATAIKIRKASIVAAVLGLGMLFYEGLAGLKLEFLIAASLNDSHYSGGSFVLTYGFIGIFGLMFFNSLRGMYARLKFEEVRQPPAKQPPRSVNSQILFALGYVFFMSLLYGLFAVLLKVIFEIKAGPGTANVILVMLGIIFAVFSFLGIGKIVKQMFYEGSVGSLFFVPITARILFVCLLLFSLDLLYNPRALSNNSYSEKKPDHVKIASDEKGRDVITIVGH